MPKRILTTFAIIATAATMTFAQTKPPAPKTGTKPEMITQKIAAAPTGKAVNIRVELVINDQVAPASPGRKVVTMIVADGQMGNVRSLANVRFAGDRSRTIEINADAHPMIIAGNRIRLDLGLEYQPTTGNPNETGPEGMARMSQRLSFILESGKPLLVAQAADPASERKVTVEVTATILE